MCLKRSPANCRNSKLKTVGQQSKSDKNCQKKDLAGPGRRKNILEKSAQVRYIAAGANSFLKKNVFKMLSV